MLCRVSAHEMDTKRNSAVCIHGVHLVSGLSGSREICGNFGDYRESGYLQVYEEFAP